MSYAALGQEGYAPVSYIDSDCDPGHLCIDDACKLATSLCTRDADCGTGGLCISGECVTVPGITLPTTVITAGGPAASAPLPSIPSTTNPVAAWLGIGLGIAGVAYLLGAA